MQKKTSRRQKEYLVLKADGLRFLKMWFGAPKSVPPNLTKLYQLLLHMATMKKVIPVYLALRTGYTCKLVSEAARRGYVELSHVPRKPSEEVLDQIKEIIGKQSREMYG
jgi:hypothetical protein